MINTANLVVLLTAVPVAGFFLLSKKLHASDHWRAMITPLASIMGSGFLVCAPLLYSNIGNAALFAMAALLLLAYAVGTVIRFNIRYAEPLFEKQKDGFGTNGNHKTHKLMRIHFCKICENGGLHLVEKISHLVLAAAYTISVSYYLQLLASFALHHFIEGDIRLQNLIVTTILMLIGAIGTWRGLKGIERVENIIVSLNLALISALIAGLVVFNLSVLWEGGWHLQEMRPIESKEHILRLLMGLLIIVQGFETSRFLGDEHSRDTRIKTMRYAQILSSVIYLLFIGLMAAVIGQASLDNGDSGITAIIALSGVVATILPIMITLTAIGSQLSAATADDAGCAGLIQGMMKRAGGLRLEYAVVSVLSIALTWMTDIYEIISIASRAFALYYMLQSIVALMTLKQQQEIQYRTPRSLFFMSIAMLCAAVAIFGIPAG